MLFASAADNLVPDDSAEAVDIFSRDIRVNATRKWTRGWVADDQSVRPNLSVDGRYVSFDSLANNLVPEDERFRDVFVADVRSRSFERVSVSSTGGPANEDSSNAALSGDGRYVAFLSRATNLTGHTVRTVPNVFVHDRRDHTTSLVSINDFGDPADGASGPPEISDDGRLVVFSSPAANLVAGDDNGVADVFVRDLAMQTTTRVSVSTTGRPANAESTGPVISGDGRFVAFLSAADNLADDDNNGAVDVFVHDLLTGQTQLVSVNSLGESGAGASQAATLTFDGRYVAFVSLASDLVRQDENSVADVFVRDLQEGRTRIVSLDDLGFQANDDSIGRPAISDDARYIAFASRADNLVVGDTNQVADAFIHDAFGCLEPIILQHPRDRIVFVGERFTLTVAAAGTPNLTYQWRKDGFEIPDATDDEFTVEFPIEEDAGVYDVRVSNDCGEILSDPAVIEVSLCVPIIGFASVSAPGAEAWGTHLRPSLSADGRYMAFDSDSGMLVPQRTAAGYDVFVRDRHTGQVVWISRALDGGRADGASAGASISADGRFVAFASGATNLVESDTNGAGDVFVRDRDPDDNGTFDEGNAITVLVSVSTGGQQANAGCGSAAISGDGRFVAFSSRASNLVPGGGNNIEHVYLHDRQTGETIRASADSQGVAGNAESRVPSLSHDGALLAFWSRATNLDPDDTTIYSDIFVHERLTGTTRIVSVDSNGFPQDGSSSRGHISASGRYVAIVTQAMLAPGIDDRVEQVYVRDLQTNQTERVSVHDSGEQGNLDCRDAAISADGRRVVFYSDATNLVDDDFNAWRDAFVRDRQTHKTRMLSVSEEGEPGDGETGSPTQGIAVSADGFYSAFVSRADNLVPHDNNPNGQDIFIRNLARNEISRASTSGGGISGSGDAAGTNISNDGRYVVYQSGAANLVIGDTNQSIDVFRFDRLTGETVRVNRTFEGHQTPNARDSRRPAVSADGRYVAYMSGAENIVPNDLNGRDDVFVQDMHTGLAALVSISSTGEQGNFDSASLTDRSIAISGDGRWVAFQSGATNLVPDDTNDMPDVFLHDRDPDGNGVFDEGNGVTIRLSQSAAGGNGNSWSDQPAVSSDGRFAAFRSNASNLIAPDVNGEPDVFVHEVATG
ncbi:MAG: PD40 domain-containing protein, partial [Planctomycetes bacterium]|nr:PD40 domain-containing protein [Planctomycetota bacterium]